jgi:MFS family permease
VAQTLRSRAAAIASSIDRPIAVLAALAFISQVGVSIMLPLLPLYAVQIGATPAQLGLMVGAFSVTSTVGQLGAGFLAGRISARRQLPLGQSVYAAGNFLIALASSAVPLIAFRALSGFGGGLTIIAERLYIARVTAQSRLAFVNGVVSAAGSSGSVVGPLLGAALAVQNLQIPFLVVGVTASIAAVAAIAFLPPERAATSETAVPTALPEATELVPEPVPVGPAPRASSTRAHWRLANVGPLLRLGLWSLAFNAAYGGWITTFAPYSTAELGLTPSAVALFFVPFGAGAIVLGPFLARIADRTGRRRMIAVGTALVLLNTVTLILRMPVEIIYGTAALAGAGLAAATSSWFALLGVATDGGRRGRSFGLVSALSNLGVIAGAAIAATAWSFGGPREGIIAAAGFLVLGIAALALVPSDRRRR